MNISPDVKEIEETLRAMLMHSCVSDTIDADKFEEDIAAERRARALLDRLAPSPVCEPAPAVDTRLPIATAIGATVRRYNRCGPPEMKGAMSTSCELAATEIVLQALTECGYRVQPVPAPAVDVERRVWRRVRSDGRVTYWETEVPDGELFVPATALTTLSRELEALKPAFDENFLRAKEAEEQRDAALNKIEVSEYKLDQAVNVVQPMVIARAEAAEARLAEAGRRFDEAVENCRKAIEASSPSEQGWRTMDSAPKDGTKLLLAFDGPFFDSLETGHTIGMWTGGSWFLTCIWATSSAHRSPTHWMPLPSSPSEQEAGK